MKLSYLDTSAAMKLLVAEPESVALAKSLSSDRRLASAWLLHTELHSAAGRHPDDIASADVQTVLNTLHLADLTRGDMIAAGTHAPLRSHDAIHLAVAIRLGVDEIVTYDNELAESATAAGLVVFAPASQLSPETTSHFAKLHRSCWRRSRHDARFAQQHLIN